MSYVLTKVANNFNSLSAIEQEALFANYQHATSSDLVGLSKFKVLNLSTANTNLFKTCNVVGIPNDSLVLPKSLFGDSFNVINSITITDLISDITNAKIRYIVTKDLVNYYYFDITTQLWVKLSTLDSATALTQGMTTSTINSLTATNWGNFYDSANDTDGIGIGFVFSETATTQITQIDTLAVNVDIRGMWNKAVHGTDYNYGYSGNKTLRISLLSNGSYKINYRK